MKTLREIFLPAALPHDALLAIIRIVLLYALFATLWILLSDRVVSLLFGHADDLQDVNTYKGIFFVAVTAALLFFLMLRFAVRWGGTSSAPAVPAGDGELLRPLRRKLLGGVALLSLAFVLLGTLGILQNLERHRATAAAQMQSIARLKAIQIETWLGERYRDARVVRSAPLMQEALPRWRKTGDPAARARLQSRLDEFLAMMGYAGLAICDARGNILLQAGGSHHGMSDPLRATLQQAIASGEIRITDLFQMRDPGPAHVHLDIVAPLPAADGVASDAAIVLRIDVAASLYAMLQTWPVPSVSAETLLFRQEGDAVLFLNELRHEAGSALVKRIPLSQRRVLAVQALAADYAQGEPMEGIDYRNIPVLGVALPIAGTRWWLIAKEDLAEVDIEARRDAVWIVFGGLLTWIVAVVLALLFHQHRELQYGQQQHLEQAEKLRALRLLDAIVNGSTDAIFAKDKAGCYLLFNDAAARLVGKAPAEVIGNDDRLLFSPEQAERIMENDRAVMAGGKIETYQETIDTTEGEKIFLATKGPLRDAAGQVVGLFGVSRDISELKRNEETLLRQTLELTARNVEMERFNRAVVGRELDMIVLKRLVNNLSRELGREAPYDLDFVDQAVDGGKR